MKRIAFLATIAAALIGAGLPASAQTTRCTARRSKVIAQDVLKPIADEIA